MSESGPTLPSNRAVIVQFRARPDLEQELFASRVEHLVSGQATHFESLEELTTFLLRVLEEVQEP